MNEQMISKAVEQVLREMNSGHEKHHHECKCKKHKMTLAVAKSLIEKIEEKAKMEREMIPMFERALKENRILVYLQPKVAIESGIVVGAEALVRMLDDNGKIVPPMSFIPILERTGMIIQLDFCVLEQVLEQQFFMMGKC